MAVLLAVALGADTRVETGVFTEARARRLDPAPTPAQKDSLDLSVMPHLLLTVKGGLGTLSASYTPRLTGSDVGPDLRWEHMHEGELRLRIEPGSTWSLQAFATGGIGRTDLITENRNAGSGAGAGTGAGTGTTNIVTVETVDLQRARGGLVLRLAPDRRTEVLLSGAVSTDGGTNQRSRVVLPVARGAEAGAELRWNATRLDQLGLRAAAAQSRIADRRADSAWASGLATWRRHLSPQLDLWSGAGAVLLETRLPAGPGIRRASSSEVRPAGELGLARTARPQTTPEVTTAAQDVTGTAAATLGASVDRITGVATPELDLRADLRWPATSTTALLGRGSGALAWPDAGRIVRGQVDAGASFQLHPRVPLELGGYASWQHSSNPGVPNITEYGAYLRLGLDAPPLTY